MALFSISDAPALRTSSDAIVAVVEQFEALRELWGIRSERDLRRLSSANLLDLSCAMYRQLQSLTTAGSSFRRRAADDAPAALSAPSQGPSSDSNRLNATRALDGSDVIDSARIEGGKGTESAAFSEVSNSLAGSARVSTVHVAHNDDAELPQLTEDALAKFAAIPGGVPDLLVSQLRSLDEDDVSSDDVSDTRMSVSRSDAHDDGIFDGVNDYILLEQIGRGQTGRVMRAVDTVNNQTVAVKILPRHLIVDQATNDADPTTTKFKREVVIMKRLKHRNIARLIEVIDDPVEKQVFLVMPLLPGGPIVTFDAQRTCETPTIDVVRRHLSNIVSGLSYLKKHRIVHRDLKPDNVLISDKGVATLVDFGQSEWVTPDADPAATTEAAAAEDSGSDCGAAARVRNLGTPAFMAPEVVRGEKPDFPSDVWSLGVILYCMLYGRLPFRGVYAGRRGAMAGRDGEPDLLDQILYAQPELNDDVVDCVWNDLLTAMLEKDPTQRITLSDIKRHAALLGAPGSRSVSSMGSEIDISGLTPRDFGDLESGAVTERRRPLDQPLHTALSAEAPKNDNSDASPVLSSESCLQSPVQRLPAHQRLARFRLSGAKGASPPKSLEPLVGE